MPGKLFNVTYDAGMTRHLAPWEMLLTQGYEPVRQQTGDLIPTLYVCVGAGFILNCLLTLCSHERHYKTEHTYGIFEGLWVISFGLFTTYFTTTSTSHIA